MVRKIKKWLRENSKLATVVTCVLVLSLVSLSAVFFVLGEDALESIGLAPGSKEDSTNESSKEESENGSGLPLEESLASKLNKANSDEEKLAVLEEYTVSPDADWRSSTLSNLFLHGSTKLVRLRAFRITRELALKDGHEAIVTVHRNGLRSMNSDVKQQAIIGCRDKPKYELLNELIEVVDNDYSNRHLAVQALAFMDAPQAQRKVLETAKSEEISRAERVQAILLLSRTDLTEAIGYLQELTIEEDGQFRKYALAVCRGF